MPRTERYAEGETLKPPKTHTKSEQFEKLPGLSPAEQLSVRNDAAELDDPWKRQSRSHPVSASHSRPIALLTLYSHSVKTARRMRAVALYAAVILLIALVLAGCSADTPKTSTQARPVRAIVPENRCDGNTPTFGACLGRVYVDLDKQRARLSERVVAAAVQPDVVPSVALPNLKNEWRQSERAFVTYRDQTCSAVNIARIPGTWAGIEATNCAIRLTRERMALLRIALDGKGAY